MKGDLSMQIEVIYSGKTGTKWICQLVSQLSTHLYVPLGTGVGLGFCKLQFFITCRLPRDESWRGSILSPICIMLPFKVSYLRLFVVPISFGILTTDLFCYFSKKNSIQEHVLFRVLKFSSIIKSGHQSYSTESLLHVWRLCSFLCLPLSWTWEQFSAGKVSSLSSMDTSSLFC